MKYFSNKKGFTLIELLVVIAIIGVLTAIVTANLTQAKAKSRDAKRVSDLAQIQLTLEMIFDRCNTYPSNIYSTSDVCPGFPVSYFISVVPKDNGADYQYVTNPSAPYVDYVLKADLETNSSALSDDVDGSAVMGSVDCDDANHYYCVQPK